MDQKSLLKGLLFCLLFFLIFLTPNVALEEKVVINENLNETRERYLYHAFPMGKNEDQQRELVEIELFGIGENFEYTSKAISSKSIETISLKTDREGRFISGIRRVSTLRHQRVSEEKIWRVENKVLIERNLDGTHKLKQIDLPRDKILAVSGSLLILLRLFPFQTDRQWKVFMVDFSAYSVTVTVRQSKIETLDVPAGKFECYRMEVVVGLPMIKPTLTYWLTTDKPHFLVKSIGKRGPFTSTYITTLLSK